MTFLNLGIVAHVDAGKTSLTERLLYESGAIAAPGRVDAGTTRTDSMDIERRRGITVRAAVTSFELGDLTVNLVDTPGHPDFIAEVERSLSVLDAAVLVLSAVEGVQAQSVVIWRALQRLGVPTLVFVNKIDRAGADVDAALAQVRQRLTSCTLVLSRAHRQGGRDATVTPLSLDGERVVEAVAEVDDAVLARWVDGQPVSGAQLRTAARRAVATGRLTPVLCGSALRGNGVRLLGEAVRELLPRASVPGGAASGTVFAIDRDDRGRRTWVRLWSGRLAVRDRLRWGTGRPQTVTELAVSEASGVVPRSRAGAGQIVALRGLDARIGETFGPVPRRRGYRFPPATLLAVVEPTDPAHRAGLFPALVELAEEDPLIDARMDGEDGAVQVRLHGEVQREVIGALLEERYGIGVRFSATSTLCIERVVGVGEAVEHLGERGNPYLAGVGLRVEAAPSGHGVTFDPGVEPGRLPPAFVAATEEGVRSALQRGLQGWSVVDCHITMTSSRYLPRQSKPHQRFDKSISSVAGDFRSLAPVVLAAALRKAGTVVCQPVDRFSLELPDELLNLGQGLIGRLQGVTLDATSEAGWCRVSGEIPSARIHDLATALPTLTNGAAVLRSEHHHHAPVVAGPPPSRRRPAPDAFDRERWFREVSR